ncbi:Vacuolar protein sorting-associated protein 8 homolog [Gryllus bimaculatus]|nr:Vacuolar protein sorting-associated protein 8 homolog [Gryllus bimaculatus]
MADVAGVGGADLSENVVGSLNLEIEELDDAEYNIPPVEHTPTLESILHDLDDRASLSEDDMSNCLLPTAEGGFEGSETLSLGSMGSRSRSSSEQRQKSTRLATHNNPTQQTGSILRHVILKGISSQLMSASERINAGMPTAMAATTMIAVGTSHGLVLLFDASQTLRWCLGATEQDQGSVSSLSFNHDCTRLLAGYARGHILMFDVQNGKILRTMVDVHPPGTAVLHVKFTDLPTLALCSDSGGSVFELNFRRTMGIRGCDSKCLFSGSRGEVCCIEPLLLHPLASHPLQGVVLIAMATLSKIIVVSIRPRMQVIFTHPLHSTPAALPLITWQFVIIQMADASRVVDPVLAFARESTVYFFQVSVDARSKVRLAPLQKLTVPYILLSVHWLNTRTLAAFDTLEQLHLLDVRTQEELEVLDLSGVGLVYGTSHFKGLCTGGNVSKAMALAGERACYNSVVSFGNQMLILGTKSFHVLTIRTWNERLNHLVKQGRYLDALALGMAFYQDRAKAVVGLKGPKHKRKEIAHDKVLEILNTYIEDILMASDGNMELYQEAIPACVEYCIELEATDLLFGRLWDAFADTDARGIYLESLEPWLLNDRLQTVRPDVMQAFVRHYEQQNRLQALEACLVHVEVSSLDVHQVMSLCWAKGLYDAIIHVHNRGLRDYVAPIRELMPLLQAALATGKQLSDNQIALGNKLLVYISCCLAGRAYPVGDIPEDDVQSHSSLKAFLHFDTREFLNVLALAFEEPEFMSELGLRQVQRLVDILLLVMVQGDGYSPSQVGSLFTFLARQLAKPWCSLHVERQLFEQVVEFLTEGSTSSTMGHHEERQQALLELIRAGGLQHYNQEKLLAQALKAAFYRVCELLYEQRHEYDKILQCYLKDPLRRPQVFSYLRNILLIYTKAEERVRIESQVVENIKELLDIDAVRTGQIVTLHLSQLLPSIIDKLQSEPPILFQFLQGLFDYRDSHSTVGHMKEDLELDPHLVEQYIELLCQYNPDKVYSFLVSNEGYRLDQALQIVKKHNSIENTAYLLEKTGDFQSALNLLLTKLDVEIQQTLEASENGTHTALHDLATQLMGLCQRGSATLDENGRRGMWFPLLESLMKPQREVHGKLPVLQELTQQLLTSMSGYVSLPAILQVILKDPAYKDGKFGDIRELMMGMLSNSCYEETLLQTTSRLLSVDLHNKLARLMSDCNRGLSPRNPICALCRKPLDTMKATESAILFRCGHCYHAQCMKSQIHCCLCVSSSAIGKNANSEILPIRSSTLYSPSPVEPRTLSASQGLLHSQEFALKLAPPPIPDLEGLF